MKRNPFSSFDLRRESGAARLKLLVVLALIALVGYSAYQYVPVAY